jgi:hypothetical protein
VRARSREPGAAPSVASVSAVGDPSTSERDRAHAAAGTGWLPDVVKAHLGSHDVSRLVYGATIGLALVVALQAHPPGAGQAAALLIGTAVAVGLAEVYSAYVGDEARTRRRPSHAEVLALTQDAGAVTAGAGFPAVFFLLAAAGALELDTAFNLAKWSGLGLICAYGYFAARLAGSRTPGALLHAAAVGAIGGVLIALKAVLH